MISTFGDLLRHHVSQMLLPHSISCGTHGVSQGTLAQDGQLIGCVVTCSPATSLLCMLPPVTRVHRKHCVDVSLLALKPLLTQKAGQE